MIIISKVYNLFKGTCNKVKRFFMTVGKFPFSRLFFNTFLFFLFYFQHIKAFQSYFERKTKKKQMKNIIHVFIQTTDTRSSLKWTKRIFGRCCVFIECSWEQKAAVEIPLIALGKWFNMWFRTFIFFLLFYFLIILNISCWTYFSSNMGILHFLICISFVFCAWNAYI